MRRWDAMTIKNDIGKMITARGPLESAALGKVMMHEHLHCGQC